MKSQEFKWGLAQSPRAITEMDYSRMEDLLHRTDFSPGSVSTKELSELCSYFESICVLMRPLPKEYALFRSNLIRNWSAAANELKARQAKKAKG